MTIDLARTLHDAVDGTGTTVLLGHARPQPDAVADTVAHMAGRIKARRAVRAGARAGVGLVTVGAFAAFGGQLVGRRGADDLLPAAVPGAAPGTCGSSVADLVSTGGADIAVDLTRSAPYDELGGRSADAHVLGPLVGRDLAAIVRVAPGPTSTVDLPGITTSGGVTSFRDVIRTNVIVVHHNTVVAVMPASTRQARTESSTPKPTTTLLAQVSAHLVTCETSQDSRSTVLPEGSYEFYPVAEYPDPTGPDGLGRSVGGPLIVSVLPETPLLSGLPAGFPTDVPVIGGRLLEAKPLDGTTASGWTVTVAVDGIDGVTRAIDALGYWPESAGSLQLDAPTADGRWQVRVTAGVTSDGGATVVYVVNPS